MKAKLGILAVLILVISMTISGCAPGQAFGPTFTPIPTATQIPTMTPIPTATPLPIATATATVSAEDCSDNGGKSITLPVAYLKGTISQVRCYDVWSFTEPKGTKVQITMTSSTDSLTPDFSLITDANDTCTSCTDMKTLENSENTSTQATLTYTLPYTGDYYVVVGGIGLAPSGSYSLSIQTLAQATVPTKIPVQSTKAVVKPTQSSEEPTQKPTQDNSNGGEGGSSAGGGMPVTITNNASREAKIVGVGPATYTVIIEAGQSKMVYWLTGQYTFKLYEGGVFIDSISYTVDENHAIITIN